MVITHASLYFITRTMTVAPERCGYREMIFDPKGNRVASGAHLERQGALTEASRHVNSFSRNDVPQEACIVMALSKTGICNFGWKAKDFALKGVDGKTYTRLTTYAGQKARLLSSSAITAHM
jgi:hypothetical protein